MWIYEQRGIFETIKLWWSLVLLQVCIMTLWLSGWGMWKGFPVTNKEHSHFKTTIFTDDEGLDHQGECEKLALQYPRDIRIIHYNIQSLLFSINELRVVHESKPFSLISLSETWLSSSVTDDKLHVPGYCIIRRDCCNGSKRGGVAIYHSDELSVKRRTALEHKILEQIVLEVHIPNRSSFLVSSVYTPPKLAHQKFLASLSEMCLDSKRELIVMGDLNFNQLSDKDNTHSLLQYVTLIIWTNNYWSTDQLGSLHIQSFFLMSSLHRTRNALMILEYWFVPWVITRHCTAYVRL